MKHVCLCVCFLAAMSMCRSQIFQTGGMDLSKAPRDSLRLQHEWWVGAQVGGLYGVNYGTLTAVHVGGEAPTSPSLQTATNGGSTYGFVAGGVVEYRPFFDEIGFYLHANALWSYASTVQDIPRTSQEFARNATYETQNSVLYTNIALGCRYQINPYGLFVLGGVTIDVPMQVLDRYIWQHETQQPGQVQPVPGEPTTSIQFDNRIEYRTRLGFQLGVGYDILAGLFGYRRQLVTPYIAVGAATPMVAEPTAWGNITARVGVMWRYGF
jgi:hypothetical protein